MARARNIKPGVFRNEDLIEMSAFTRLLFIGLWTLADREGRIEDRPKKIKLEILPYDKDDIDEALAALHDKGFIDRYEAGGVKVIEVVNFLKHQTPHGTEKDSQLPDKNGDFTVHERSSNGYVTGIKRATNVSSGKNNVKTSANNVDPPLPNVSPPLPNSGLVVGSHPDSLIPDSLNQDQKHSSLRSEVRKRTPEDVTVPDWVPAVSWRAFVQHRKDIRKPLTANAAGLAIAELEKLKAQGHEPAAVINQSIVSRWAGLFPLKGGSHVKPTGTGNAGRSLSAPERVAAAIAERDAASGRTLEHGAAG